jgi:transposase
MTRALDPDVMEVLWETIEPLLPPADDSHPLGCHNPRVPDRVCFRGILIRLVTGTSWTDIEAIMDFVVSDTTLRRRRDEWIDADVFDAVEAEAREGYDRILGLDLSHVAIDGSLHKAPCGVKEPGKAQSTEQNWVGSGRSRSTLPVSRSGGLSTARTATTSRCLNRLSTRSLRSVCSKTSIPSVSIAATTIPSSGPGSTATV